MGIRTIHIGKMKVTVTGAPDNISDEDLKKMVVRTIFIKRLEQEAINGFRTNNFANA